MLKRVPAVLAVLPALAFTLPCLAAGHSRHALPHSSARAHATSFHASSSRMIRGSHTRHAVHAAMVSHEPAPSIGSERATAIQAALIHAGYLSGEPTGVWDAGSVAAMQKLQDDNGWQTKYTPDSRALAKLGLGSAPLPATLPTGTPLALDAAQSAPAQP